MRFRSANALGVAMGGLAYLLMTGQIPVRIVPGDPGARIVPFAVGGLLVVLALADGVLGLLPGGADAPQSPTSGRVGPALVTLGAAALYLLILRPVGFIGATALFVVGMGAYLRSPRGLNEWVRLAIWAVGLAVVTYWVFAVVFDVPVPSGGGWIP